MVDKQPLELNPEVGDLYELTYVYQGEVTYEAGPTKALRQYFSGVDEISLIKVQRASDGSYLVKIRVDEEITHSTPFFSVPGFRFVKMEEQESALKRLAGTVLGIFMGGG